jgi:polyisoprenyl-phosphate glycosyltransferase
VTTDAAPGRIPSGVSAALVEISVVVPVYDCDECLRSLHERLTRALRTLVDTWEIVLVDDRSRDGSWSTVRQLAAEDRHVKAVRLSRNFGQHAAITAGISESAGRWTVVIDCDLQDPPEAIADLYAAALHDHDIVFARRRRRRQSLPRRFAGRMYFTLRRALAGVDLETEHSNLSMISAKARDAFLAVPDAHRNYLLILYWLGFKRTSIEFEHAERFAGRGSYTLRTLLRVAADGLIFQTTALLRWIVYVGFAMAAASIGLVVFAVYQYLTRVTYPGWTSLAVLLLSIGGFIIICVGLTGLYVGKVFEQVRGRPLFVIDERLQQTSSSEVPLAEVRDREGHA